MQLSLTRRRCLRRPCCSLAGWGHREHRVPELPQRHLLRFCGVGLRELRRGDIPSEHWGRKLRQLRCGLLLRDGRCLVRCLRRGDLPRGHGRDELRPVRRVIVLRGRGQRLLGLRLRHLLGDFGGAFVCGLHRRHLLGDSGCPVCELRSRDAPDQRGRCHVHELRRGHLLRCHGHVEMYSLRRGNLSVQLGGIGLQQLRPGDSLVERRMRPVRPRLLLRVG